MRGQSLSADVFHCTGGRGTPRGSAALAPPTPRWTIPSRPEEEERKRRRRRGEERGGGRRRRRGGGGRGGGEEGRGGGGGGGGEEEKGIPSNGKFLRAHIFSGTPQDAPKQSFILFYFLLSLICVKIHLFKNWRNYYIYIYIYYYTSCQLKRETNFF